MTAALGNTMLPQAAEVASLSGAETAATLMNQPELGIRSRPAPLPLGGSVRTAVPVAVPSGPAVMLFSVKDGGLKIWLYNRPEVGPGRPQTPGRICTACTLPGFRPKSLRLTSMAGVAEVPT